MAFHHMPTFLRSAIARDPFCHGGIITPEDVLRLEAKFPTLFDKPAPPLPENVAEPEPKDEYRDDDDRPVEGKLVKEKKKVAPGRNPKLAQSSNKSAHTTTANVNNVTRKKVGLGATTRGVQPTLPGTPRKTSEFHKKCTEKVEEEARMGQRKNVPVHPARSMGKGNVVASSGSSKLTRPAQSFSLEDLRATLKQVMEEDALEQNKWLRDAKSQSSPYTEDLVKKFLGWKLMQQQGGGQRFKVKLPTSAKVKGHGDATAKMKALTDTIYAYHDGTPRQESRQKLSAHTAVWSPGKAEKEKVVPRVRSAPGFLRGISELPPVPNYQKKRTMLSMGSREKAVKKQIGDGYQASGDGERRKKQIRWEDYHSYEDDSEDLGNEDKEEVGNVKKQISKESLHSVPTADVKVDRPKSSGIRGKGTRIWLRSDKKPEPEMSAYGEEDDKYQIKSSYKDLLAARSEKTRYQVKGFLRKQEVSNNFYTKQLEREREQRKSLQTRQGEFMDPTSSSDPSENFTRRISEMGQRSKKETSEFLRKMAEELVYQEVLHQINEYKQQQEEAEREQRKRELFRPSPTTSPSPRQKEKKISEITMPQFVPTTASEQGESASGDQEKKSEKSSEIVLKTPELTPPSMKQKQRVEMEKKAKSPRDPGQGKDAQVKDVISLHTPDLSPSPRRLIAAIKERKELAKRLLESPPQHLDTDCSEMSDFVFSEPSKKEPQQNAKIPEVVQEESEKLETPELSNSKDQQRLEDIEDKEPAKNEGQEKDGSTLSGVPSTFLETPSASQNRPEVEAKAQDDSHKSSAKYSDDFTPEKEDSSKKTTPVPTSNAEQAAKPKSSLSEIFSDDDFKSEGEVVDNMNTSGETVIDMLSEGEFIGDSYRSPGELSWRQRARPRPQPSSSNQSAVSSSNKQKVEQQVSFVSSTGEDTEDGSISVLSLGAQIVPRNGQHQSNIVSIGEYLRNNQ